MTFVNAAVWTCFGLFTMCCFMAVRYAQRCASGQPLADPLTGWVAAIGVLAVAILVLSRKSGLL